MQSHYEINVALNGRHFFATDPRSITNTNDLEKVLTVIIKKFPESEGFKISISYQEILGYGVERKQPQNISPEVESKRVAEYFRNGDFKKNY